MATAGGMPARPGATVRAKTGTKLRMNCRICLIVVLLLSFCADALAAAERTLKYPSKTQRTLWTDQEIAQARRNVSTYPATAGKVAQQILRDADYWAGFSDDELVELITEARVPRAFETGTAGCPRCGHELYQKHGQYGWEIDPKRPFKVKCPVDGSIYPTNDYFAYYVTGEKKGWDTSHVDDGWGWTDANGEKHWFVAYFNHWNWHKRMMPGLRSLGRAYLLTGDKKYAHKAVVMLHRVAEVYPAMDHAEQSRYGQMSKARGIYYGGKVVNKIWETGLVRNVAEAYDCVWETIDGDEAAQQRFGKTGGQIRAFIEANFLEDAIDAVLGGKIRGNFGMHQSALVSLATVRQFGQTERWFDELLDRSTSDGGALGLEYALYNMITRDGFPAENGPGYNFIWVSKIAEYGELLDRMGRDVFALPRTKRLFDAVLDQVVIGACTPSIGDSGTVWGGIVGQQAATYQAAYRRYGDARYARWLDSFGATGEKGFASFESLMQPIIAAPSTQPASVPRERLPSRVMDGYGQAILNNADNTVGLSLFYGWRAGHGHFDRMNIDVFAAGAPLTPDLGYPDAMNDYVKGIYTWSKNTISHNTVTVDGSRQQANEPGTVKLFADSPFARVIDVDAAGGAYPQCSIYRRAVVMVDVSSEQSYFVDFFTVVGGEQHDYSLHGPPGDFEAIDEKWSEPANGTLAGANVELGYAYDAPHLEAKGYAGGFTTYAGSGFQHLFNVRRLESGQGAGQWVHQNVKNARLRIRVLDQPGQELMLCDARVSPVKHPQILRYLIARTKGENLSSRFVSVIEPYRDTPMIKSAARTSDGVRIERADGLTDLITFGGTSVRTLDRDGTVRREFSAGGAWLLGVVEHVEPAKSIVRVRLTTSAQFDPAKLAGRLLQFRNTIRQTSHPVISAQRDGEMLTLSLKDDLLVGKGRIDAADGSLLTTRIAMTLAPLYRGTMLCDAAFRPVRRVVNVSGGKITLNGEADRQLVGKDVWFVNVGMGDELSVPQVTWSER